MMNSRITKTLTGLGFAATLAATLATPVSAAPFSATSIGLASGAPPQVEQVGCRGCWVAGGVAAGVLAGAAIAGAASRPYYRDQYYYDEPPVVYAPAPRVYYAPPQPRYYAAPRAFAYGKCWVQTGPYQGQGYYGRC